MNRLLLTVLALSLAFFANASQEGVLSFSEFSIKSRGIGKSGTVEIIGTKNEKGTFSSITVSAFGKMYSFPEDILSQISAINQNGIQLTYEAGYRSLGGKTIYIQFQKGFTSGVQSVFLVSLNEQGKFEVLK
ncbi:MAG: hypothetical protein JKX92_03560 [Porticoccaceae bacterium]|nr:hypothetical protein [Porticoccaceae bacterium]